MRITKKAALIVLAFASMLCLLFGAVACGGASAKEAIERYILPQNETLVDADFTLPKTIGSAESPIAVEWKSDNTAAIAIEDGGENYNAKVTLQSEVTPVKLTISAGGNSKDFTVRVDELSVYTFMANYKFAQRKTSVKEDFNLETETAFQGKTATISWEIDEKYNAWINLNETKNKVLVTPGEDIVDVEIVATFSYNGEEATQKYPFSVVPLLEHRQTVNRLYSITDYPLELSGYIVHVVEASESYGNATFYMIDDDFCSGYYCYRVKIDTADIAKYVVGAHVTVSGDTTKNYNGLWENNSGGTAVVDDKAPIDPREKVYAMDTDLLSGVPSLLWHESTFVSLSGWKVASKPDTKPAAADNNLFTLQRGDTKITVRITKYMQRTAEELAALCDVYDAVNVGDFVNVTGILGNYNGFQIQPVLASDITKVDTEGTDENAPKVKAAVNAVDEAVKANFSSLIASAKEVTMPTSVDGVTISYKVAGAKSPTVAINGGTFNINPIDEERNYDIEVTYSIGGYEAYGFFKLHNWKQSSEQIVDNVKAALEAAELAEIKRTGEFDLPVVDALGTTITWSVKNSPDWISIADGKIKVTALPAEDTEVTLVATIALDGQTATAKLTLKVAAASAVTFKAIDAPVAGTYKLAMDKNGTMLYFSGEMDGFYYGTVTEAENAADVVLAGSTSEGWTLKTGNKFLEIEYAKGTDGNMHTNVKLMDAQTAGKTWTWDATNKVFTWTVDVDGTPTTYFLGTDSSKNYTTISANTIDKISSYCTAKLGEMAAAELTFKAIDAPAAGDYIFAAMHKGERLYASSLELDGSYIATTNDETMAVKLTIEKKDNAWLIKMGAKYLEVNPYNNSKGGVSYNLRLVDSATEGAVWEWDSDIKIFKQKPVATEEGVTPADAYFYIGMRDDADFVTMSPSDIKYITGSNASKLDVTQHPSRFGEMVIGEPGTTEPEEPEPGPEPEPEENFKPITAPVAGSEYYMGMKAQDGKYYYLTGAMSSYYMATTTDIAGAKKVTLAGNDTDGWTLMLDGKYIEIVASGTHINAVYNATKSGAWTWDATHSFFTWTVDGSAYALGTYGTFNTVGTVAQSRFDDEGQWFAVLGTYDNGGTTEPEEPEHVHNYTYTYDTETGWQHKGHCDVEGCPEPDITKNCAPVLNICPDCEHEFTQEEILTKLFESKADTTLSGTYSLTGKVLRIDTPYDGTQYYNVTFTIKVGDKEIQCFREKSDYSETVKPGDTVTVQGTLKHYYNGTKEFDANCKITVLTAGELTDEEKVSEVLRALTLPASAKEDVTLPASAIKGVQLTWTSDNQAFAIENNTLKVVPQSEEVTLKITVTAKSGSVEQTKEFTVTIPAALPDGAKTISVSINEYATENEWKDGGAEVYSTVTLDENIEVSIVGTGNTGKYYTDWRIYQVGGGGITITAKNGYTLYSVKVTYTPNNNGILISGETQLASDVALRVSGTSVTLMVGNTSDKTNGQARITAIEVVYSAGGTQPEGPGTTVTFTEDQQGTFQCTMKQIGEEGDPEMNPEDVPALVVSANSIKWGEKTVTILEDMGSGTYLVQIDGENYGLSYTGGWMLTKFGPEEEMLEGYMFGDMGGLY